MKLRRLARVLQGIYTTDGAGVSLYRVFGGPETYRFTDPFLLLDFFGSSNPDEYLAGFPWHPHRGIETVTYLMRGKVEHEDSEGNRGVLYPGDTQWMTAGSGIYHQEMPRPLDPRDPADVLSSHGIDTAVMGLQLWINLPHEKKMTVPVYRDKRRNAIPVERFEWGTARVIGGSFMGVESELKAGHDVDPTYAELALEPESELTVPVKEGYTSLVYVIEGSVSFSREGREPVARGSLAVLGDGDALYISSADGARVAFLSGRPLREPIAWYGPIVMNTRDEIVQAVMDLRRGTFVRDKRPLFL